MKKLLVLFFVTTLITLTACGNIGTTPDQVEEIQPVTPPCSATRGLFWRDITNRDGYIVSVPREINTIVTLGPSKAEILVALGFGDRIIAVDRFAYDIVGLGDGVVKEFGIMDPDAEYIVNLMPDIIFVSGPVVNDESPLAPIVAAGITVITMPTSTTVSGIMEDIRFVAAVMGDYDAGEGIVEAMQADIDEIMQIAATISEPRKVYFEVAPLFSLGSGTFLNELIELAGAINIFADLEGWIPVSDEVVVELNPDVILTSTNFLDDPIADIVERPGFDAINAVQNGDVFRIDTALSNRPTHNITRALRYIAIATYPEYFK